jgi:hypothetical protein
LSIFFDNIRSNEIQPFRQAFGAIIKNGGFRFVILRGLAPLRTDSGKRDWSGMVIAIFK